MIGLMTLNKIRNMTKIIITDSINLNNVKQTIPFFKNKDEGQVHCFSIFQEGKLGCLMCNGYLKIFDIATQKCQVKARIWSKIRENYNGRNVNHIKWEKYDANDVRPLKAVYIYKNDEYEYRKEDFEIDSQSIRPENLMLTQLPNKLIILYDNTLYPYSLTEKKIKLLGEYFVNEAIRYNLISLTKNRICIGKLNNTLGIYEANVPFKHLFSLKEDKPIVISPSFQLSNTEILISYFREEDKCGLISWDLNSKQILNQFSIPVKNLNQFLNVLEIANKKIIMSIKDYDYIIILNGKTLKVETTIEFKENMSHTTRKALIRQMKRFNESKFNFIASIKNLNLKIEVSEKNNLKNLL